MCWLFGLQLGEMFPPPRLFGHAQHDQWSIAQASRIVDQGTRQVIPDQ